MVRKLSSSELASTDVILSIGEHARAFRTLTIDALAIMLATGLVLLDSTSGFVLPYSMQLARQGELPRDYATAVKLGKWFSELSSFEIASALKVTF